MSNNYSNHDVPGYSGNYDPCPSSGDSTGTSADDDSKLTEKKPYVSKYGFAGVQNIHQDTKMFQSILMNIKIEQEAIRKRRLISRNRRIIGMCRTIDKKMKKKDTPWHLLPSEGNSQQEMEGINMPLVDIQPEIKIEPVDEIEEETGPFGDLPEISGMTADDRMHLPQSGARQVFDGLNELQNRPMFYTVPIPTEDNLDSGYELLVQYAIPGTSTIHRITNPGVNELDNGNTNIIENPVNVPRRTRRKKEVISTPTRISSRIKKPRIMYDA